jgi:hypothetical protein
MMENEIRPARERAATWFIAAVMIAALIWFLGQADWFAARDTEAIPATVASRAGDNITMRRGLVLPVLRIAELRDRMDASTCMHLHEQGVNWIVIRLPMWIPSPRRLEYDNIDFRHVQDIIHTARAAGLAVSLAPVYWDGDSLHDRPPVRAGSGFLRQYRGMLLEIAAAAAAGKADALLLDGLFGNPGVSASDWLQLLADLRSVFPGLIEARIGEGYTPSIYLRQLDGALLPVFEGARRMNQVSIDSLLAANRHEAGENTKLLLTMRDPDGYAANGMPWNPQLSYQGDAVAEAEALLQLPYILPDASDGFFLYGAAVFDQLTATPTVPYPLSKRLRELRRQAISEALQRRAREHTLQ